MPDISQISLFGTTYNIKDSVARESIKKMELVVSTDAATTPKGVTWTKEGVTVTGTLEASDANTQHPNAMYLVPSSSEQGNIYDEYVVVKTGTAEPYSYAWEKIGSTDVDLSNYVQYGTSFGSSSYTYTPTGSIDAPTFTGTGTTLKIGSTNTQNVTITNNFSVTGDLTNVNFPTVTIWDGKLYGQMMSTPTVTLKGKHTPSGTVSKPTFTGTGAVIQFSSVPVSIQSNGFSVYGSQTSLEIPSNSATGEISPDSESAALVSTGTITPEGTVSQPTFTGTAGTVSVSAVVPDGVTVTLGTTPASVLSDARFAGATTTVNVSGTAAFTVTPSHISPTVSNEVLVINWATPTPFTSSGTCTPQGSVNTSSTDVVGSVSVIGTGLTGNAHTVYTGTFTPAGTVSTPTFTGTSGVVSVSGRDFSGFSVISNVPTRTVNFTPNVAYTGGWTGTFSASTTFTPSGTVSQPTFTGTEDTVTVTGDISDLTVNVEVPSQNLVCTPNISWTGSWSGRFSQDIEYTPEGTISAPVFHGDANTHSHTVTLVKP